MRYLTLILRIPILFFIMHSFECLVQANEENSAYNSVENQINVCNISEYNDKITLLFPIDSDINNLKGIYHGVVKKIKTIIW